MRICVLLLAALLLLPAGARAQGGSRKSDDAPWFDKNCYAACANLTPQPCADVNDDACFRKSVKQQRRQDQCIRQCEEAFWGKHFEGGYRQFMYR